MNHAILGEIKQQPGESADLVATIAYGSGKIEIQIIRDDQPIETTVSVAAAVAGQLQALDQLAKQIAVRDLLGTYNSGWNEYDQVQADGSLKTVSNPKLSPEEFEKKLSLVAVNVTGRDMIEFFYEDCGMFWGHSVIVSSLNGLDFQQAIAELFG